MDFSNSALIKNISKRDFRSIARTITLIENQTPRIRAVQSQLFKKTGRAHVIGVTGSPGAGKSTLVDQLARQFNSNRLKTAILAIDPSSPFSGGAILGDRIRMMRAEEEDGIFIRSMASRGSLGGVARATVEAVQVLDAAGFDVILVETVGVGQGEVDIVRTADTCIVVLVPGMGDSVQSIKAGILEIADIFVINKSDRDEADLLEKDLRVMLSLAERSPGFWKIPIVKTVATTGKGVVETVTEIASHKKWLHSSDFGQERRLSIIEGTILKLATESVVEKLKKDSKKLHKLSELCLKKKLDPYGAVKKLIN